MIKKVCYLKVCIICFLIFIYSSFFNNSYAMTQGTVYLTTNKDIIEKEEEIEIIVNIENISTAAYNFSLYFDDSKLEYISESENTNVIGNRVIFTWYDQEGGSKAKTGELVRFKFKAKEEGTATFSIDGLFYSETAQLIKTEFKETQIQIGKEKSILQKQAEEIDTGDIQANNTNLETLAIEGVLLYPAFDTNVTNYEAEISNKTENINMLAIPENENATVTINGKDNLKEGENLIDIIVTAPNGFTKKKYQVLVYKRNAEEENKYNEEQELNKQKLEQIYKTEKLNAEEITEQNGNKNEAKDNFIVTIIALVILAIIVGIAFIKIKRRKEDNRK